MNKKIIIALLISLVFFGFTSNSQTVINTESNLNKIDSTFHLFIDGMGDYKKAVYELEKAVEIVPNDPVINDHLGDALWRAGYKNEAIFQWKRSLLYNPEEDLKNNINYKLKKGL